MTGKLEELEISRERIKLLEERIEVFKGSEAALNETIVLLD